MMTFWSKYRSKFRKPFWNRKLLNGFKNSVLLLLAQVARIANLRGQLGRRACAGSVLAWVADERVQRRWDVLLVLAWRGVGSKLTWVAWVLKWVTCLCGKCASVGSEFAWMACQCEWHEWPANVSFIILLLLLLLLRQYPEEKFVECLLLKQ